jgi:hypothetical protein
LHRMDEKGTVTINGFTTKINWELKGIPSGRHEELPVPVTLCPPQILHRLTPGVNPGLRSEAGY